MELIIHILEAVIVACMAFVMVIAVLITRDLSRIIENMNRKIDTLQHNSEVLMKNVQELEAEKAKREESKAVTIEWFKKALFGKSEINVVDKPLDFPNEKE